MKYDYFIIGNSAAAVGCIEGIRRESKNGKICVVSDENYRAYGRPLISYFLWGKTSEENMLKYRPKDFYEKKIQPVGSPSVYHRSSAHSRHIFHWYPDQRTAFGYPKAVRNFRLSDR